MFDMLPPCAEVTESERAAVEAALSEKMGPEAPPPVEGSAGNSPYSMQAIVFRAKGTEVRGARVALARVAKSHDGAGGYKGRGRWRKVFALAEKANGPFAFCNASDRDAEQVCCSGMYLRPWATHEAEEKSKGLGLGAKALAEAFGQLGL